MENQTNIRSSVKKYSVILLLIYTTPSIFISILSINITKKFIYSSTLNNTKK